HKPPRAATCFPPGALGASRIVKENLGRAVRGDHRDAVALKNAEVGCVAQVVALPAITVRHDLVDAGRRHGGEQALPAGDGEGGGLGNHGSVLPRLVRWAKRSGPTSTSILRTHRKCPPVPPPIPSSP